MITYNKTSIFGYAIVFQIQGSAIWKAILPALFSTGIMLVYVYAPDPSFNVNEQGYKNTGNFVHPYAITAYVLFFSFLLTFRLNYAYQRYWEGASAVFLMLSKWLDVATYCAAYHHQSEPYDQYRPPSFGDHEHLYNVTRERERDIIMTEEVVMEGIELAKEQEQRDKKQWWKLLPGTSSKKKKQAVESERSDGSSNNRLKKCISAMDPRRIPVPRNFHDRFNLANRNAALSESGKRFNLRRRGSDQSVGSQQIRSDEPVQIPYPSLFLQEIAHLVSLMSAVALSTLRSDRLEDGAPAPLREYFPGEPLPPVNPDELGTETRKEWDSGSRARAAIYYMLGLSRSEHHKALYNAARPFQVLGGISDMETERLRMAHGPMAKVSLCNMYVQEFVAREYQSGSTGKIPGPLISRITHVLSDGMMGYSQARKLAYNPFPFPHAQMTSFFTIAVLFIFPLLYYSFVNDIYFACVMNFITVGCFLGIHEVARELENPFQNVPNDLPLTTFQAEFNEALVTIYSGFHPDSWWDEDSLKGSSPNHDVGNNNTTTADAKNAKENVHPLKNAKENIHPLKR